MAKFFNIINGPGDTACILLYGDIGGYEGDIRCGDIVRELLELETSHKRIDIRINSNGGEVYPGIAIFNALKGSKADITIYIDGIAASMASAIAMSRRPVYMSKYARLMLHSVRGGAWGSVESMKGVIGEMESLQSVLVSIYSERSGKSEEEIKALFFDGKDHWLTAAEAAQMNLIDGIYDIDPIAEDSQPEQIYNIVNKRLHNNTKSNRMDISILKKRAMFANVANDDQVVAVIENLEAEAGKVSGLSDRVTQLTGELNTYKAKEQEARKAEIASLVDAAVKDGRIKEPQRPVYVALMEKDFENGKNALEAVPVAKRATEGLGEPNNDGLSFWDARMKDIKNSNSKK